MKRFLILVLLAMLVLPVFAQDADEENAELMRGWHAAMRRTPPTEKQISDEHAAVAGVWEVYTGNEALGVRVFTGKEKKLYLSTDDFDSIGNAEDIYDIYWPSQTQADRMTIVITSWYGGNWMTFSYIFKNKDTIILTRINKDSEWYGVKYTFNRKK